MPAAAIPNAGFRVCGVCRLSWLYLTRTYCLHDNRQQVEARTCWTAAEKNADACVREGSKLDDLPPRAPLRLQAPSQGHV